MGLTIDRGVPIRRVPGRGRPPRVHRDRKIPLLPLAAAAILIPAAILGGPAVLQPTDLTNAVLEGPRKLAGRACLVLADDLSGSMAQYAGQRQAAKAALLPWLKANLQPDDQVALADFTDQAVLTLPATSAAQLPAMPPAEAFAGSGGTAVTPAVQLLGDALQASQCAATALVMITDGKIGDPPDLLAHTLAQHQITRVYALNPDGGHRPAELDHPALRGITVLDIHDADDSDLALRYASLVAELTGQELHRT